MMLLCRPFVLKVFCVLILAGSFVPQLVSLAAAEDPGSVQGVVFFDTNGNGIRDRGEPGFAGVAVALFGKKSDGSSLYLTTRTDSAGRYVFAGSLVGEGSNFTVSTGGAPLAAAIPTIYHPVRTFYAAADGDDANPGTDKQPFRTLGHAVPALQAGDLLYIRQGQYRDYVSNRKASLGGGTGWDRPIVVCGMPGETVVIRPSEHDLSDPLINLTLPQQQYLIFDNLVLDGENLTQPFKSQAIEGKGPAPSHIRVVNCELRNAAGPGAIVAGEDHQFLKCCIHNNGQNKTDHGFAVSGGHNLIQGCDIYLNAGCGIALYSRPAEMASNNVLRGNRIHDNGRAVMRGDVPVDAGGYGIGLHSGVKNLVYDNVIWGNPYGIVVAAPEKAASDNTIRGGRGPSYLSILNNTVTANFKYGVGIGDDTETHDNLVRNNIISGNHDDPNLLLMPPHQTTVCDHNRLGGNPSLFFRDPSADDFHLLPKSDAIDAGVAISEVLTDHDGIRRPQGKDYDCGAYEYSEDSLLPTPSRPVSRFRPGETITINIGFKKAGNPSPESKP